MGIQAIDKALGVVVISLGLLQCLSTSYFFHRIEEPAAWFFAGGMLLMLVGALTLLRIRYGLIAPGVKHVSIAANLMVSLFWVGLYWGLFYKFVRHPASFLGLFVILSSTTVSVLHAYRQN
ncbi:MAG TPA: hypothetical protein VIQ24_11775 [Pyrinomonadaceae bacterium]